MYKRFEKLLKDNNTTSYKVCKDLGISPSAITAWKQGRTVPKSDSIKKIADYFSVPMEYFYEKEDDLENLINKAEKIGIDTKSLLTSLSAQLPSQNSLKIASEIEKLTDSEKQQIVNLVEFFLNNRQ